MNDCSRWSAVYFHSSFSFTLNSQFICCFSLCRNSLTDRSESSRKQGEVYFTLFVFLSSVIQNEPLSESSAPWFGSSSGGGLWHCVPSGCVRTELHVHLFLPQSGVLLSHRWLLRLQGRYTTIISWYKFRQDIHDTRRWEVNYSHVLHVYFTCLALTNLVWSVFISLQLFWNTDM